MYILLGVCENPGLLKVLYFVRLLIDIVFTIVPIGLIVMLLIDFSKALISSDDMGSSKDVKNVGSRIVSAMLLFAIPWVITVFVKLMNNIGFDSDYITCMSNAESGDFSKYEEEYNNERASMFDYLNTALNNTGFSSFADTLNGTYSNKMADRMIEVASAELGNNNYKGKYGTTGLPWCAMFATWVMDNTEVNGVNLYKDIVQKEHKDSNRMGAACTMYAFKNSSHLSFHYSKYYAPKYNASDSSYIPKKGDLVYFDWNGDWNGVINTSCWPGQTWIDHIGIVKDYKDGVVYTIEGNSSKQVREKSYAIDSKVLIGFGSWYKNGLSNNNGDNKSSVDDTSSTKSIKNDIQNYIDSKNYHISIGYFNIKTGQSYVYNDQTYYGASTIKTLDALYIYSKDRSMLNDETRELIKKAITVSDNNAHIELVNRIGIDNYRNYASELGVSEKITNSIGKEGGHYGDTNVATQMIYLKKLYSVINSDSEGNTLKSYYINDFYNCLEYQGSPTTMHKYGWLDNNYHDVGIVLDEEPYIVVILTDGASNSNCGQNGGKSSSSDVTELSKMIYKLHKSY